MTEQLTCELVEQRAFVKRYLAHALSQPEAESFEAHYVACAACQEALRFAAAVQLALPRSRAATAWYAAPWIRIALPIGLAATFAGVLLLRNIEDPRLIALGRLDQAPLFLGVPVRVDDNPAGDSVFQAAMRNYVAHRFPQAAQGLRAALGQGFEAAPTEFFLAASRLMTGEVAAAAQGFDRVIALGDTPYGAEARYYRAKALLRLARGQEALGELRQVPAENPAIGSAARALADSIAEVLRR